MADGSGNQRSSFSKQLAFIQLDDVSPDDCNELWSIIEQDIDAILADFYTHLAKFSPKSMYERMDIPWLSVRQHQHWKRMFTAFFSEEYVKSARKVGAAHDDIGLSAEWYIGAYTYFQNRMVSSIFTHYDDRPEKALQMTSLLTRIVGLDMAIVMSVYQCD